MKLLKYKVTNFRSVQDSGWITIDDVTAFIGINESGKSNLLIPLWKLNPAEGGEIKPVQDYPRSNYNEIRQQKQKPIFIQAQFKINSSTVKKISSLTGYTDDQVSIASVSRRFDGTYSVGFPLATPQTNFSKSQVMTLLDTALADLNSLSPTTKGEDSLKTNMLSSIKSAIDNLNDTEKQNYSEEDLLTIKETLDNISLETAGARSTLKPRFEQLKDDVSDLIDKLNEPLPSDNKEVYNLIIQDLPSFVYYSNYGNLDSEIYLPTVIQNMDRDDLGTKEEAKARTLKVLFDFVNVHPQEILELGKEQTGNAEQLAATAEKKTERDVLLQSAGTQLTREFTDWWKQGNYRFRFAADGNFFRIWVSDDKRPEDIELENRSTGLQWFLSFFLVFLVEAKDSHENSILLLDEPGLTLHPLAQKDLSKFFDNLSKENQIIYSTHSPFMVEADKLDRVKAVYIDEHGKTVSSPNLRASAPKSVQEKSIYAVHASLGLTISDVIMQGCKPVIVEGISDQFYLTTIKDFLQRNELLSLKNELLFIPAGGTKGIKAVAPIVAAKENELPAILIDSDKAGLDLQKSLHTSLYQTQKEKTLMFGDLLSMNNAEAEDFFDTGLIADCFSRLYRDVEESFSDTYDRTSPIVPQIENFAEEHSISLEDGWKVELAKASKRKFHSNAKNVNPSEELKNKWIKLFNLLDA